MNPWTILDLPPEGADKRTLKKAYATLIKKYRPDENPEKFQEIHQAYKCALGILRSAQEDINAEDGTSTASTPPPFTEEQAPAPIDYDLLPKEVNTPPLQVHTEIYVEAIQDNPEQDTPAQENLAKMQAAFDQLTQQTQSTLKHEAQVNRINRWYFLSECDYLFEDDFNSQLGEEVFSRISQFNLDQFNTKDIDNLHIKPHILKYLNDMFAWDANRDYYYQEYGDQKSDAIFTLIDYANKNLNYNNSVKGAEVIHHASQLKIISTGRLFMGLSAMIVFALILKRIFY